MSIYVYMHILYIYSRMYVYMYVCIRVYVYVYICLYV
jgi:hypothetical protein